MGIPRAVRGAFAASALAAAVACAQEPPAGEFEIEVPPEGSISTALDGSWVQATGGVDARYGTFRLRADSVVWFPDLKICYAEGGVRFLQGGIEGRADEMCVLLEAGDVLRGSMRRVHLRLPGGDARELHLGAEVLRLETKSQGDATEREFTFPRSGLALCDHGVPHVVLASRRGVLRIRQRPPVAPGLEPRVERSIAARGSLLRAGWIPLLPLPPARWSLDSDIQVRPRYGQTEILGPFQGIQVLGTHRDRTSPWLARHESLQRLRWQAQADHYDTRGWAGGAGADYRGPRLQGFVDAYGLHDRGRDREFRDLDRADRWRWRLYHRQDVGDRGQLDVEGHVLSDAEFRETFFEREAKSGKRVENRIQYTYRADRALFTVLQRTRANDFLDEVEAMPRARAEVFSLDLPAGIVYRSETEAANLRRVRADTASAPGDSFRRHRFDTLQHVARPFSTGPVQWEPFGSVRQTWWNHERPDRERSLWRGVGTYGASASTEAWRTWGPADGSRTRHEIVPQATFTSVQQPNVRARQIDPFDEIDDISPSETVLLEVRQALDTRSGREAEPWRAATLSHASPLYTHPGRDNLLRNVDGRLVPRRFGPVRQELRVYPAQGMRILADLDYDTYRGVVPEMTLGAGWNGAAWGDPVDRTGRARISGDLSQDRAPIGGAFSDLVAAVEHRFQREGPARLAARLGTRLSDRWWVAGEMEFEFRANAGAQERRLALRRDCHDFILEIALEIDADGQASPFVSLTPRGMVGAFNAASLAPSGAQ